MGLTICNFNFALPRWRLLTWTLFFVLGLSLGWQTHSQEIGFSGLVNPYRKEGRSDYVIRSWGQADGLPRNSVHSIAQTPDGFLWLGTSAGLARFDGAQFKVLSPYTTSAVPVGTIESLFVDSQGCMWIGSLGGGIAKMQDGTISEIDVSQVKAYGILSFAEDSEGRIWVGSDGGLFYVQEGKLMSDPVRTGPAGRSSTVAVDSVSGGLYTCYWEFLVHWGADGHVPVYCINSTRRLMSQSIYSRRDGGLWFLSSSVEENGALARLVEPEIATGPQKWPFVIPQYGIGAFLEDGQRNLWISVYEQGVYRVAPNGEYELFRIGNMQVVSLFEDQNGSIWAGSSVAGLHRLRQGLFQNFTAPGSGQVGTVSAEPSGDIIFNESSCAYRIQNGEVEAIEKCGILAVYADQTGNLWTVAPGSLEQYGRDGLNFSLSPNILTTAQPAKQIRCILESRDGQMWFGSLFGGILTSDGKSIRVLPETQKDGIFSLAEDANGTLWAGTSEGALWSVGGGQATRLEIEEQIDHRAIAALCFDAEGVLWLGTMGRGLVVRKGDQFVATLRADGLPSNEVVGIVEVGSHLWLATTGGIARVNRDELFDRSSTSGPLSECLVFGPDDGLLDFACSSSYSPNMHQTTDGRLWIAMVENVVSIDPNEVSSKRRLSQIYIEEVRVNDEILALSQEPVSIPAGPARVSFSYTAVALEAPERIRFQYRLEGLDTAWVDAWDQRTASYNSPLPGDYRFQVRASDSLGQWGDHAATLRVRIEPHFWQTLSFKLASVVLIGTVFGSIVWLAARVKLSRRLVLLEQDHAIEKERARIASEIHDQLGAQLTQILFQSHSLTGRLDNEGDEQSSKQAGIVNSSAQELARGLDEVVWATNPEMDNLEGLVAYISSYAEEFFRHTPIRLRFDVPISLDAREMSSELRHNLFLAASEAMTNVLKHAGASQATVQMRFREDDFVIEISDDGRGLASESSRRLGNGLRNMNERMRRIGGAAAFIPCQPQGLTVRLSVVIPSALESVSPKKGIHSEEGPALT